MPKTRMCSSSAITSYSTILSTESFAFEEFEGRYRTSNPDPPGAKKEGHQLMSKAVSPVIAHKETKSVRILESFLPNKMNQRSHTLDCMNHERLTHLFSMERETWRPLTLAVAPSSSLDRCIVTSFRSLVHSGRRHPPLDVAVRAYQGRTPSMTSTTPKRRTPSAFSSCTLGCGPIE